MNSRKESLIKMKQMRRKVLENVEQLLETDVDECTLIERCKLFAKCDYDDVNVERSLTGVCGYPLCSNRLQNISKQQYKISLKTHKVYDLSERKLFCSNRCFKASSFIKQQLPEEAFWVSTDCDRTQNCVEIYREKTGSVGNEVDIRSTLNEQSNFGTNNVSENKKKSENKNEKSRENMAKSDEKLDEKQRLNLPYIKEDQLQKLKSSMSKLTIHEKVFKQENGLIAIPDRECDEKSEKNLGNEASQYSPLGACLQCLSDWVTVETRRFILGDDFTGERQQSNEKLKAEMLAFYQRMSKKLDIEEKKEELLDEILLGRHPLSENFEKLQIVFDKISNSLNAILGKAYSDNLKDGIKKLLQTMNLTPSNITLKTGEWSLISILILRLLCHKNSFNGITDVTKSLYSNEI
ncbi:putative RNA polymerase II subunit B1 CTD phosphatase RPAP2-like protein [Dinothrombium tinctorium]|uniref:RNA polymerase II subunit B1 CTD phosphatase RPAP2 homolog n=1 Tax=Dinothrombium tinctorium TaxID=1965070 RepID=A0A3S3P6R1_9ACAR|nr:putative RNA polymerase II subunit B1 CTD phosphatase RPAP2-like protein [Dinothrombium tinctorium]